MHHACESLVDTVDVCGCRCRCMCGCACVHMWLSWKIKTNLWRVCALVYASNLSNSFEVWLVTITVADSTFLMIGTLLLIAPKQPATVQNMDNKVDHMASAMSAREE